MLFCFVLIGFFHGSSCKGFSPCASGPHQHWHPRVLHCGSVAIRPIACRWIKWCGVAEASMPLPVAQPSTCVDSWNPVLNIPLCCGLVQTVGMSDTHCMTHHHIHCMT